MLTVTDLIQIQNGTFHMSLNSFATVATIAMQSRTTANQRIDSNNNFLNYIVWLYEGSTKYQRIRSLISSTRIQELLHGSEVKCILYTNMKSI